PPRRPGGAPGGKRLQELLPGQGRHGGHVHDAGPPGRRSRILRTGDRRGSFPGAPGSRGSHHALDGPETQKESLRPGAMFANMFIQNRPFVGRMRNRNYQLSHVVFKRIQELSRQDPFQPKEMIRLLDEYITQLEITLQHASDAIRGLKRRKLVMYRQDKEFGVLEEEIVLT